MESKKQVVLVDATEEFRLLLKQAIEETGEFEVIGCTGNGREALDLIEKGQPQILITDLTLPELDGLALLTKSGQCSPSTKVIVLSAFCTDQMLQRIAQLGAYYFLVKPCQLDSLLGLMRQACQPAEAQFVFPAALEGIVTSCLHNLGMPAHLKGFRYVREAILLTVREPDLLNALTKELYPRVGKAFGVNHSQVERSIRTAIEHAWDDGNQPMLQSYFRFSVSAAKPKPCNGSFIAILSEDIRRQLYRSTMS
ncbi:MAG: sporulation transcription factor Spo0A [Eubacteriales bacterium]|nr:sporulation transcription factor Spo0A [Eubacteriales bacterium]